MSSLTQESVLSFLLERGGQAKNSELLHSFRSHIGGDDPAEKLHNRELFKRLVNSVAVVKQTDGVKFVVVKKRYQDFVRDRTHIQMEDSFSPTSSFSCASPQRSEEEEKQKEEQARRIYSDMQNNNVGSEPDMNCNDCCAESVQKSTLQVLNISGEHVSRAGKSGAVFAVIAVKSPPPTPQDGPYSKPHQQKTPHSLETKRPVSKEHQCLNEEVPPSGSSQLKPQTKSSKQSDDTKVTESVPLEPLVHEWMVKCAAGLWGQIPALLRQDTRLAHKKDFMSGFTALHWAAKDGNCDVIRKLVDFSRRRGTRINVNGKSHGGYTPLHIAAIHGHAEVAALLVQRYGASVLERDNAGKKACHYLAERVSDETRALLGGLQKVKSREKLSGEDEHRDHVKGFNTISKLFHPHGGRKHRTSTKYTQDW